MPLLLLIRHGTNDYVKEGRLPGQAPNIHLNDEGRTQAATLANMLKKHPIAAIYSSQLERAIETAWPLAAARNLPVQVRPALADTHAGTYTGKKLKELSESPETKDNWKIIVEKPSEGRLPGGESLLEMQQRVVTELERICAEYPDPEPPEPKKEDADAAKAADQKPDDAHADQANNPAGKPKQEPEPQPPAVIAVVMHSDPIKAAVAHYLGMPFDNFQRLGTSPASLTTVMVGSKYVGVMNLNLPPSSHPEP